jgi:hypothetical protein
MLNDPLFLQTKNQIESWRKTKKHIREPIPEEIKQNITDLSKVYPVNKLGTALKLGACSQRFLRSSKKPKKEIAQFVELSHVTHKKEVTDQKRIELDLPMGMTMRIFL